MAAGRLITAVPSEAGAAPVVPSGQPEWRLRQGTAMAVQRLGHVAVRVQDMARAKAFYEALGLRVTWDADDWAYLQSPESGDGIALLAPSYRHAGPHFAFHFEDRAGVDRVHAQLEASGHRVGPIHDHRDGTASFYLQDSEGNWLEMLYEPPTGIASNTGQAVIPLQARAQAGRGQEPV